MKFNFKDYWKNNFAIERDVDITNECAMLNRRNIVVKNIVFYSNLFFTLILFIIGMLSGTTSNLVMTGILLPLTFIINRTLKKLIIKAPGDYIKQMIAEYFCVFYMFLISFILYIKLMLGASDMEVKYQDSAYILIYYAMIVMSLYQDPKLIKNAFPYLLSFVTIFHFTLTYDFIHMSPDTSNGIEGFIENIKVIFKEGYIYDIFLRTLFLVVFFAVLYITVFLASRMQEQRKTELLKRQNVQDAFVDVVVNLFDSTLQDSAITSQEKLEAPLLEDMVVKLSQLWGMDTNEVERSKDFATIHYKGEVDFDVSSIEDTDKKFEMLESQTELGNNIIRRLQIRRKSIDIYRAGLEGWNDEDFKRSVKSVTEGDYMYQIVLLCDLYILFRNVRPFKRTFNHQQALDRFETEYHWYFDRELLDRFIKFSNDFNDIYVNFVSRGYVDSED